MLLNNDIHYTRTYMYVVGSGERVVKKRLKLKSQKPKKTLQGFSFGVGLYEVCVYLVRYVSLNSPGYDMLNCAH